MSNLKCPFCQQELTVYEYSAFTNVGFLPCEKCKIEGTKEMWEALIHTRKALDVAVSQLKKTRDYIEDCRYQETNYFLVDSKDVSIIFDETNESLKKITALEQKDVK